ncbi:hypothetical protein L3X38_003603 [Prunus dulcis]|uniref:Uncharacterized protein n=1 Tax=Prunus dulcis TaxID=3755 RepID=A0AAD4ZME1_PRUDU|nr:hypothetical protein L3X38_003603 [Prunus dulcis]
MLDEKGVKSWGRWRGKREDSLVVREKRSTGKTVGEALGLINVEGYTWKTKSRSHKFYTTSPENLVSIKRSNRSRSHDQIPFYLTQNSIIRGIRDSDSQSVSSNTILEISELSVPPVYELVSKSLTQRCNSILQILSRTKIAHSGHCAQWPSSYVARPRRNVIIAQEGKDFGIFDFNNEYHESGGDVEMSIKQASKEGLKLQH